MRRVEDEGRVQSEGWRVCEEWRLVGTKVRDSLVRDARSAPKKGRDGVGCDQEGGAAWSGPSQLGWPSRREGGG